MSTVISYFNFISVALKIFYTKCLEISLTIEYVSYKIQDRYSITFGEGESGANFQIQGLSWQNTGVSTLHIIKKEKVLNG